MCEVSSPGGRLVCANPRCNGRSHVWVHESSAPDKKRDDDMARQGGMPVRTAA